MGRKKTQNLQMYAFTHEIKTHYCDNADPYTRLQESM